MGISLQRTPEWFGKRKGKVTASKIDAVVERQKNGSFYAKREDYKNQLILEVLTGNVVEGFISAAMQHGIDTEEEGFQKYRKTTWMPLSKIDFVDHPFNIRAGASPDGLVGDEGLIEIKCPNSATHISTLRRGTYDPKYYPQMQWQLACTNRKWVDFVSYDPRLPEAYRLFVDRVERDELWIAQAVEMVQTFWQEIDAEIAKLHENFEVV